MSFEINQRFIADLKMNDHMFYESLISELEEVIENELSKQDDEINVFVIDECCVAVENLRAAQVGEEIIPYETIIDIESIIKLQSKRKRAIYISSAACAAVAVLCAVISLKLSGVNEQGYLSQYESSGNLYEKTETNGSNSNVEESATPPFSQATENITIVEPISTTEQVVTDNVIPSVTEPIPMIYKMDLLLAPGASLMVSDESQIETVLANSFIAVTYTDESVDYVSIDECQVEIGTRNANGEVKVTVTYKNMSTDIYVIIE